MPYWEETIKKAEAKGPKALISLVIQTLEAWADTDRILWTQTGSQDAYNRMTNYSALAYALKRALRLLARA